MDDRIVKTIQEQIEFLKADLKREIPLNMDSEFQPEAASKITETREETKRQIIGLMNRLAGVEPIVDDKQYFRQMLEKISSDRSAIDAANEAASKMEDDEVKERVINKAVAEYEATKREIAAELLKRLD